MRLPLQIGTSSSWAIAGASVFFGVSLVLAWALAGAVRVGLPVWIWFFLAVPLMVTGNLAFRKLRKARRLRPSDAGAVDAFLDAAAYSKLIADA